MYNPNVDHGAAEYLSWVELTSAEASALQAVEPAGNREDNDTYLGQNAKFAHLVKIVNPGEISGGGGGGGTTITSELAINRIIYTQGNETFICTTTDLTANPSDSVWRLQKVYQNGSSSYPVAGSGYSNPATNVATVAAVVYQLDGNGF